MDGKSSIPFSYRIVARRKDIKRHRRFAKIDTRLPAPPMAAPSPRKRKAVSRSSALRAFVASLEKEARAGSMEGGRSPLFPSSLRPHCTCGLRGGGKRSADEHQTLTFYEQAPQASVNAPTRSRRVIAACPSAAACAPVRATRFRPPRAFRARQSSSSRNCVTRSLSLLAAAAYVLEDRCLPEKSTASAPPKLCVLSLERVEIADRLIPLIPHLGMLLDDHPM